MTVDDSEGATFTRNENSWTLVELHCRYSDLLLQLDVIKSEISEAASLLQEPGREGDESKTKVGEKLKLILSHSPILK